MYTSSTIQQSTFQLSTQHSNRNLLKWLLQMSVRWLWKTRDSIVCKLVCCIEFITAVQRWASTCKSALNQVKVAILRVLRLKVRDRTYIVWRRDLLHEIFTNNGNFLLKISVVLELNSFYSNAHTTIMSLRTLGISEKKNKAKNPATPPKAPKVTPLLRYQPVPDISVRHRISWKSEQRTAEGPWWERFG